ncbi:GNAT family N-acetyltransferase [Chromobacterium subtsugae]|uniref:GNAT family N-acetyltransferase n=1 Tax=Chromobacterium subtsugae TaxID=251747 RepID=UPI00191C3CDB|nr:GNAT family N-acetyltransferase [Chromobacterium subtsugae]
MNEFDHASIVRLYTDPQISACLGGPVEIGMAEARASALCLNQRELPAWAIRRSDSTDSRLLGMISLDLHHDGLDVEVSYELLPEYWGQGYADAALKMVLRHALETLHLRRLVAETQARNHASIRLLRRNGFRLEKTLMRFDAAQYFYSIELSTHE